MCSGAALLHATWNIIVKGGDNKLFESAMNALGGGLGALCLLPFLPLPDKSAWGFLLLSCCCHLTYYVCIAAAYKIVDLSLGYTIMRGCAPMLTALVLFCLGRAPEPDRVGAACCCCARAFWCLAWNRSSAIKPVSRAFSFPCAHLS